MKLNFVSSKTLYEATKQTLKLIDFKNLDERNLVIVPDVFSMQAESLIFDVLNIKSTFNITVVGISRLASKLLRENNIVFDRVSGLDEILLTYKAVKDCEKEFLYFKNYGADFAVKVLETLKVLSNSRLLPKDIELCDDPILSAKMHDLKLIYSRYLELLEDKLNLTKLLEFFLDKISGLENYNLYFVNFDSFSSEIFNFICCLSEKVKSVTIAVAKASSQSNSYIYDTETQDKMFKFASENGIELSMKETKNALSEKQNAVLDNVFALKKNKLDIKGFLSVEALNERDEVEFCAKDIKYNIAKKGKRYRDFALAVAGEEYYETIKQIFNKYEIPYYMDYNLTLNEISYSKFLFKVLEIAESGFNKSDIEYLLSSPFLNIDDYQTIVKDVEYFETEDIEKFQEKFGCLDEIIQIIKKFKNCENIRDFCENMECLIEFTIKNIDFYLDSISFDLQKQSENKQAVDACKKIFKEISNFKYDEKFELKDFIFLCNTVFKGINIETVPSYIDAVYVGDVTKSYFEDVDVLFVLGAVAGKLPKTDSDSGILTDADLAKYNGKIEPETRIKNRRNRLKLFEVLQHFKEDLIVLSPVSNGAKKASFVEDLISANSNRCTTSTKSFEMFDRADLSENEKTNLILFNLASKRLCEENFKKIEENLDLESVSKIMPYINAKQFEYDYNENLKTNPLQGKISTTQLEHYFSCPFKHFLSNILKITEQEYAKEDKRKIGILKHSLAKLFVDAFKDDIKKVEEREIKKFLEQNFLNECKKVFEKVSLDNFIFMKLLKEECLVMLLNIAYEQSISEFKIAGTEQYIASTIAGKSFVGFVDRIDVFKDYFRIIDYKTGEVGGVLKDLYYGKKLQLFLYAKVESEKLKKQCAGIYYFDCKNKFKKKNVKQKLLDGITLKDDKIVLATDYRVEEENFKSDFIGVERTKQPKDNFSFKYGNVKDNFDKYFDYAEKVSAKAIEEIEDGYIAPKPLEGECEYCPYNSICKFEKESVRKQIKNKEF